MQHLFDNQQSEFCVKSDFVEGEERPEEKQTTNRRPFIARPEHQIAPFRRRHYRDVDHE